MKKIVFILFLCATAIKLFAISDTAFVRTFGGTDSDIARDVKQTSDNGFILLGTTSSFGVGASSVYLVKTDSNGVYQWSKVYSRNNVEHGYSICETYDKGFAICGYTNSIGFGGYDMYLIKTDSLGNILWEKTYGGSDWDFGYSITQLSDSSLVMCGETYSYSNGGSDIYVVKTTKTGDTIWTNHFGGITDEVAYSVASDNDTIVVVGKKIISTTDEDVFFAKINFNGTLISSKTYGGNKIDYAKNICKMNDNGFAIIGSSNSFSAGGDLDAYLIKTDNLGNKIWSNYFGSTGTDTGEDIVQIRNGNLNYTGTLTGFGAGKTAMALTRVDAISGLWLNGAAFGGANEESGLAIERTNTGGIVYAGFSTSYGQGQEEMYFLKINNDSIVPNYILNIINVNDSPSILLVNTTNYNLEKNEVLVYPNPFNTSTTFTFQNSIFYKNEFTLELYDAVGKKMYEQKLSNINSFSFNKNNFSAGTYFYHIYNENTIYRGKIVIN